MTLSINQQSGRRFGILTHVEVRTLADGSVHVEGHAAVFNVPTQIGPPGLGFEERIAPGAFKKTLSEGADVRFLFNHNPDLVLARSKSGTLTLVEDKRGLAVSANLAPTSVGRDLAILLERGDVSQMSFGFQVVKDVWETKKRADDSEYEIRTILEAKLFDVSAVTYPAYDETDLAIREAKLARELRDARAFRVKTSEETPVPREPESADATPSPEPAHATPEPEPVREIPTEERSLPLHEVLLRHASGEHKGSPRVVCPACTQPATATA